MKKLEEFTPFIVVRKYNIKDLILEEIK